jgi:hypothetical protein
MTLLFTATQLSNELLSVEKLYEKSKSFLSAIERGKADFDKCVADYSSLHKSGGTTQFWNGGGLTLFPEVFAAIPRKLFPFPDLLAASHNAVCQADRDAIVHQLIISADEFSVAVDAVQESLVNAKSTILVFDIGSDELPLREKMIRIADEAEKLLLVTKEEVQALDDRRKLEQKSGALSRSAAPLPPLCTAGGTALSTLSSLNKQLEALRSEAEQPGKFNRDNPIDAIGGVYRISTIERVIELLRPSLILSASLASMSCKADSGGLSKSLQRELTYFSEQLHAIRLHHQSSSTEFLNLKVNATDIGRRDAIVKLSNEIAKVYSELELEVANEQQRLGALK